MLALLFILVIPQLDASYCPAPSTPENGYFYCEEEKCYLECDQGYAPDERTTTSCSDGSWVPSVNEMNCSPAFILATGGLLNSSTVEVYGTDFHIRLPNLPSPRMGHAVENVDSHIILCGGVPMEFEVFFPVPSATTECLELTDEFQWMDYPDTHYGRDIHASIALHGTIYWIGGHNSPDTMEYNSPEGENNQEWILEETAPYQFKHSCAAKISPTEFLVTGGFYDAKMALKYNVVTGSVTRMEDMNFCRSGHGCNYIEDEELGIRGVIVGGGYPLCDEEELNDAVSFALTSSSEFYDLKTGKWRSVGDMTEEKRGMRMIFAQGAIHAFGGMSRLVDDDLDSNIQMNLDGFGNVDAFDFGNFVDKYDVATETWSRADDMIFQRNFMGLALVSERKFYFGCLAPFTPEHGSFNCPVYPEINEQKKCELECDPGYAPDGRTTSICSEGSWVPSLIEMTCSRIVNNCPAPSTPENGYFYCEEEKCYLECDQGYAPDERTTTSCSDGSWVPSVNEMTCSPAFILATGGLLNSSTVEVYGTDFHIRLPNLPSPRMGHAVENVDSHIILCGGVPMEFEVFFPVPSATTECLELTDEFQWMDYPDTHYGRDIHASIALHGTIYWIGGHNSPDTMEYNSPEGENNQEWILEETAPYQFKHSCAAKISPTEFLVTGGFYDAKMALKYNVVTGSVTRMEDMNFCRSGHGCNYIEDEELGIRGVIVGGGYPLCDEEELNDAVSFALTSSSEFYDLKSGKWRSVGDMTEEKRGMRMIFAQGAIHAFGGMSRLVDDDPDNNIQMNLDGFGNVDAFDFGNYVDKYDVATETWSRADDMIFQRNFMGLALISERKFYFGCLAPFTPEHGSFNCPVYPEINEQKKCELECDPGYAPDGRTTSICSEGSWVPSLIEMTCSRIVNTSTDAPAFTCGSTMEECEAAYHAAMTPSVTQIHPTMTADSCEDADGWWVAGTVSGLSGYDENNMRVCQHDGQYMIEKDGMAYPTCVAYGNPGDDCTNADLVCPENSGNPGPGKFGWAGNHRSTLAFAMSRADFAHPECPTATCHSMDSLASSGSYWKDQLMNNPYHPISEAQADNVCVSSDNEVMVVTQEGTYYTCLGWSMDPTAMCNSQKYLCAGHSGEGEFTYGWPGQIARTMAVAVDNSEGHYMHPQCPLMICSA